MLAHSIRLGFGKTRASIYTGSCDTAPLAPKASVAGHRSKAQGSAGTPSHTASAHSALELQMGRQTELEEKKGRKQKEGKAAEQKKQSKEGQGGQLAKIWWGRSSGKIGQE